MRKRKHTVPPSIAADVGERRNLRAASMITAPASAAVAYTSARSIRGTCASKTSRTTPPPTPVIMPISAAMNGCILNCRAFSRNREQRQAGGVHHGEQPRGRRFHLGVKQERTGASGHGDRHISPVSQRSRRNVADQNIADDAATKCRGARQHQQSQQIQIPANSGHRSFNPKKKRARQIHRIEQPVCVRWYCFRWYCFPRSHSAFDTQYLAVAR